MKPVALVFAGLSAVASVPLHRRRGTAYAGAALLLSAALIAYGLSDIRWPDPEQAIARAAETLGSWTYLLVGALAYLESAAFVGLVAPGELAVVFGGFVAGRGDIDLFTLIAVVWAAALAGDLTSYTLGRKLGRAWALRHGVRFGITPARFERVERYFAAHGGKTILAGRFIGVVRALAPFLAGASRMPIGRFALVDALGSGVWAAAFSVLGYMFWQSLDRALELAKQGKLGLIAVIAVALVAVVVYRLVRDARMRRRLTTRLRSAPTTLRQAVLARRDRSRP